MSHIWKAAELLLGQARMMRAGIVKFGRFVTRREDLPALGAIRRRRWSGAEPPAITDLVVAGLARPDYLVEIKANRRIPMGFDP